MADSYDDGEEEDLHARWREWEERHARNRVRLYAVVGVTMAAIVGIWFLSLSDMVREVTASTSDVGSLREQFATEFSSYQRKLDSYAPEAAATGTGSGTAAAAPTSAATDAFVGALKTKAASAAANVPQ